ncbi:transketolase family protein [Bacillus sp. HMF5848]|uniref:transketolase family protein n=1 Tax=Bacillus sp. HMF5848 TaxID=2495421 RepID=UPI000F792B5B|nr:transketolase family protein [Bacillus sp. HMF5848]RSK25721.1 transketolase family protein [Bacillus sp. HMF5848]
MKLTGRWMREIFTELLIEQAKQDERICYLDADLMLASGTGPFKEMFPERTINMGVAEANMIGVAAGISTLGMIPFTHTFTPFATRRCNDQVTLSVSYAKNNVKMVGSDPGITAMLNGGTHMSMEDVAIMRNIPGMCIVEPIDGVQLAELFPQIVNHDGPVYIRLLRREAPVVYEAGETFELGKAKSIKSGHDVTIIAAGIMVSEAVKAEKILAEEGIDASVIDMHTIKPLDTDTILLEAEKTGAVVTAENHSVINGLGSAVAEFLSQNYPVPMKMVGVKDHFGEVGMQDFLAEKYGLTAEEIVKSCKEVLKMKEKRNEKSLNRIR